MSQNQIFYSPYKIHMLFNVFIYNLSRIKRLNDSLNNKNKSNILYYFERIK